MPKTAKISFDRRNNFHQNLTTIDNGFHTFYLNEILPDFKKPVKFAKLEENNDPDPDPDPVKTHVGMDSIEAKSSMGKYFVEFASSSTLHGLNHFVAIRRHPLERVLFVIFVLGALICTIMLSLIFWQRYQNEATVMNLDHDYENFGITKPSIFTCQRENVDERKIPTVFKRYDVEDTPEARRFFTFLMNVTYETMHQTPDYHGVPSDKWLPILYEIRAHINYSFIATQEPINTKGVVVVSERGFCVTLRNFVSVYASYEYWKSNNWTIVPPPAPIPTYYHDTDTDASETVQVFGDMLLGIYDPNEIFEYQDSLWPAYAREVYQAPVAIWETISSEKLKDLSVKQRKCKFPEDGGLKIWPIYTYKMCMVECRFEVIREHCGCYPHFARPMPNIPVCNSAQLRCISEILDILFLDKLPPPDCGCIPNCNNVIYTISDMMKTELKAQTPTVLAAVTVRINLPKNKFQRMELYGFNDFLTSVGGAAGLFLGASVLSFVEILYYLTIRLIIYKIRQKR